MTSIHPTSVVDTNAILGDNVEIGPLCVVGPRVRLGNGTRLVSHVVVDGCTTVGSECEIHPFARIGGPTQDLKYVGGDTFVEIGDRTVLRECVTINCGTRESEVTKVGSDTLLMAYCHAAHGCSIGNGVIVSNASQFAGEVIIEDRATVSGLIGAHQFTRIGTHSMVATSRLMLDAPPYMITQGAEAIVTGINLVGLTRRGFTEETRNTLKLAYKMLYRSEMNFGDAIKKIEDELPNIPEIRHLVEFYRTSSRGVTKKTGN